MNKLVIGLTGLIGSGKSTVANIFAKRGVPVIDTDLIAHELTSKESVSVLELIKAEFGEDVFKSNGELDRSKLRGLVFNNVEAKVKLENILHPLILARVMQLINNIANEKLIVVVVPLLFKSPSYLALTDYNIFVDSEEKNIFERVYTRSGLLVDEVKKILDNQISADIQINLADEIITNNSDLHKLEEQVAKIIEKYNALCQN